MSRTNTDFHPVAEQAESLLATLDTEPAAELSSTALVLPFQAPQIAEVITSSPTWPALKQDVLTAFDQVRVLPSYTALKQEMTTALDDAKALTVTDAATYARADEIVPRLGALADRAKAWWRPVTSLADKLHSWLTARRGADVTLLETERKRVADEAGKWHREQERLRQQQEAEAAREAKRQADAQAAEQAALLEAQGLPELAEAVVAQAIAQPAPAIVLPSVAPPARNLSHGKDWEIEVINAALVPREYMTPDEPRILKVVRAMKGLVKIPGVRITETTATRGRRRSA